MRRILYFMFGVCRAPEKTEWLRRWRLPIIIVLALLCWAILIGIGWLILDILSIEPARADIPLE